MVPRRTRPRAGARALHPALFAFALRRRTLYKTTHEREAEAQRDPVLTFPKFLVDEGMLDATSWKRIAHEIDQEIHEATHRALHAEPPAPATALLHLYSETVDPTSAVRCQPLSRRAADHGRT